MSDKRKGMQRCEGGGQHKGWKRGFILIAGVWHCRVCRAQARG